MRERKVLIFLQNAVGGAERISALIGNELHANGYHVTYCLVGKQTGKSIKDFIAGSSGVRCIESTNPFLLLFEIFRTICHIKPDVVFASVININDKVLLLRRFFPKMRFIIRCDTNVTAYSDKQRSLVSKTYPLADVVIAQTEEMKEGLVQITKLDSEKVIVLHNPIDKENIKRLVSEPSPFTSPKKHIVAVGRFDPAKGYETLIDAFVELTNRRKDVELYIVGNYKTDDKIYQYVINKAGKSGISDLVHCEGYHSNPYKYTVNADCYVLSSRWEGLPNALIEALYLGTPAAAVKCVPIVERIVSEGENGFLAENGDIVGLSYAMEKALDLNRVKSNYKPSEIADYIALFDE